MENDDTITHARAVMDAAARLGFSYNSRVAARARGRIPHAWRVPILRELGNPRAGKLDAIVAVFDAFPKGASASTDLDRSRA